MDEEAVGQTRRTFAATPENAADLRHLVRSWPELHALVQHLQADGLFPGLRGLQITLTGAPEWVAGGVGAAAAQIAASAPVEARHAP